MGIEKRKARRIPVVREMHERERNPSRDGREIPHERERKEKFGARREKGEERSKKEEKKRRAIGSEKERKRGEEIERERKEGERRKRSSPCGSLAMEVISVTRRRNGREGREEEGEGESEKV